MAPRIPIWLPAFAAGWTVTVGREDMEPEPPPTAATVKASDPAAARRRRQEWRGEAHGNPLVLVEHLPGITSRRRDRHALGGRAELVDGGIGPKVVASTGPSPPPRE